MSNKNRLAKLEKQKPAGGDNVIQVFIVDEDGGAFTSDATGKRTEYTAAEYAEHLKQCAARGDKVIHVTPEGKGGDA